MKKKLLTLLMAMTMTAMLITGCGEKEETSGDAKASVEESKEDDKEEAKEESKEEAKEEAKEESEEVVEATEAEEIEEVVESTEEVAESTEEVVESSEETEGEDAAVVDADGKDWSKAYDDYFQRDDVMSDKMQFNCTAMAEDIAFDMVIAMADDNVRMSFIFDGAVFDMYAAKEKVYAYFEIQGQSQWVWAPVENEEDVDAMLEMSDAGMVDTESVESVTYREALEEDGVIYDVLDVVSNDGTEAAFFINRETQKLEKCVADQDGVTMVMLVEEIESVEIPVEAESKATESTLEDIMMSMISVILAGSGAMEQ